MKARSAGVWASYCVCCSRRGSGICPVAGGRLARSDQQRDGPALSFLGYLKDFQRLTVCPTETGTPAPRPLAW